MNTIKTIDKAVAVRRQFDIRGITAVAANTCSVVAIVEQNRNDTMATWSAIAPFWQDAVTTAVRKLGMKAALTGAALAEVERSLERDRPRQR